MGSGNPEGRLLDLSGQETVELPPSGGGDGESESRRSKCILEGDSET